MLQRGKPSLGREWKQLHIRRYMNSVNVTNQIRNLELRQSVIYSLYCSRVNLYEATGE